MAAAERFVKSSVPTSATRSLDSTYNCMGMAFASRRTGIEPTEFEEIRRDDGFQRLAGPEEAIGGDIVVYRSESDGVVHVGVLAAKEPLVRDAKWLVRVLSQFGQDGEYFHDVDDLPPMFKVFGALAKEFWTERRRVP
jgi:hypothetical protein